MPKGNKLKTTSYESKRSIYQIEFSQIILKKYEEIFSFKKQSIGRVVILIHESSLCYGHTKLLVNIINDKLVKYVYLWQIAYKI